MKHSHRPKPKRGSILVTILFMVCILALLVATVANDSLQTLRTVTASGRDTQAKYAAYAGMELVMNQLRLKDRYIGVPIDEPNHGKKNGSLNELEKVNYEVLIWNNMRDGTKPAAEAPTDFILAQDGVRVQPDTVYMISTGTDTERGEEVVLTSLAGTARRVRPVFEDAAYARSKMIMEGDSLVDAWDSGGGYTAYVGGDFPGSTTGTPAGGGGNGGGGNGGGNGGGGNGGGNGGGGGNGPGGPPPSTVDDYEATLGTDSKDGRTLRMLGASKLNGYYRIGPGVSDDGAFSQDSGASSSSASGGGGRTTATSSSSSTATKYGVSTAVDPTTQIAGVEGATSTTAAAGTYHKLDDKTTEMPRFTAPYDGDDLLPPPVISNPPTTYQIDNPYGPGKITVTDPPAPVGLTPGGYESVDVGGDQTLLLSPGVYYFKEEMKVSGKIKLAGNDPVIVFVGKKAVFNSAEINKDGKTSSLQLCFTDEEKDPLKLDALVNKMLPNFELPAAASSSDGDGGGGTIGGRMTATSASGQSLEAYVRGLLAPLTDPDDPETQEGASVLEMTGGEFHGSVSGKNLVVQGQGGEIFGGIMANVVHSQGTDIHQDLALKGSNLMNAGGWSLESVHQIR